MTEGHRRGQWHKFARLGTIAVVRNALRPTTSYTNEKGVAIYTRTDDPEILFRLKLAETLVAVFYDIALRLPDIREHFPKLVPGSEAIAVICERCLRHLVPDLILQRYEQI